MTRKRWIWLFAILVVLIISAFFVIKAKAQPAKGAGVKGNSSSSSNTGGGGDATAVTNITGSYCTGLSKDEITALQAKVNAKGCKDSQGNALKQDGVFGPKSYSAIMNCI